MDAASGAPQDQPAESIGGVLVLAEARGGQLREITFELIAAALELSSQGAGPVSVLATDGNASALAPSLNVAGVNRLLLADSPLENFEAHVSQRALEAAIAAYRPSVVIAGHTIDSLGFVAAVAARGQHGFAGDVIALRLSGDGLLARREIHGGKLIAELSFPGKQTVLLTVRPGAFEAATGEGAATTHELAADLSEAARTTHLELREPPPGDIDIENAQFLLSIGRGVEEADDVERFQALAERLGATLSASRPLVDAGWLPSARQVGQSGRTVSPKVYLAMGISGAVQHLAGMSKAETIIAVNTDPDAPIFGVAHYGVVADMFEVAQALEQQAQ